MKLRPHSVDRARSLRRKMSLQEVVLWKAIRGDALGVRFRRQHPAGPYVLDFYCDMLKLAVEVDGGSHSMGERADQDAARDAWLNAHGIAVVRIPARTILQDVEVAVFSIRKALMQQSLVKPSG